MSINWQGFAFPKHSGPTPSEKHDTERKADEKALKAWRAGVQKRDGQTCRCCRRTVIVTLEAVPRRRECHHIAGRGDAAVRTDVRNGIVLDLACHEGIGCGRIHLVQKPALMFKVNGRAYINGDREIRFITKEH